MIAKTLELTCDDLQKLIPDILRHVKTPYWLVEMPHRICLENSLQTTKDGEAFCVHVLEGRLFGKEGEFRWWRDEKGGKDCLRASLVWDGKTLPFELPKGLAEANLNHKLDPKETESDCLLWKSSDSRVAAPDLGAWFPTSAPEQPALKIKLYNDPETGQLLLWRCVEPTEKKVIKDVG